MAESFITQYKADIIEQYREQKRVANAALARGAGTGE